MKIHARSIPLFLAAALIALSPLCARGASAARIRVAQESRPGLGDFDKNVLGFIDAYFEKEKAASDFYSYEEIAQYSFGGPHPRLRKDTSHLFFATVKEGLSLFIVHDSPGDEDGGIAVMRLGVEGDPNGARVLVFDDPYSDWDSYAAEEGGRKIFTWHRWFPCCTDGLVLSTFEGGWKVFLEFPAKDTLNGDITLQGMKFWRAFSADGSGIALKLEKGRRVRLDPMGPLVRARPGGVRRVHAAMQFEGSLK
jgi:hypothetical protein